MKNKLDLQTEIIVLEKVLNRMLSYMSDAFMEGNEEQAKAFRKAARDLREVHSARVDDLKAEENEEPPDFEELKQEEEEE